MFRVVNEVKGLNLKQNASLTLWLLRATGHYPFRNETKPRLLNFVAYFFIYGGVLLGELLRSALVPENINALSDGFFILLAHMAMLYKSFNTYKQQSAMRCILEDLATNELFEPRTANQRLILERAARKNGLIVTFCCVLIFFATSMWLSFPVIMGLGRSHLPLPVWYPFDTTNSVMYAMAYLHQVISGIITALVYMALDWLCLHFLYELSIQLNFLHDNFKNVNKEAEEILRRPVGNLSNGLLVYGNYLDEANSVRDDLLKRNVIHHQAVIM